jgi:predicted dehydrogenase
MPEEKDEKIVRLGLIGCGNIGGAHRKNIEESRVTRCKLAAVCDVDADRLKKYDGYPQFTDPQEMFASGLIDAVLVATPHYDHIPLGIAAIEAGLHVLIEKPLGVYTADCKRLLAAYEARERQDLVFAEMFNQRTDPRYIRLKEMIDAGEFGKITRISWTITDWFRSDSYYASGGWRATWAGEGGGVLLNQSPHQLDLYQWLFGMPDRIRAFCHFGKYHDIEVEDDVTAYMEYDSGTTATFVSTTGEAPGVNRLEFACDRGLVTVEDDALLWKRNITPTAEHCQTTKEAFGRPDTWEVRIPLGGGRGPQHAGILQNFCDAILDQATLIAPAQEGIHSVALANGMLLSTLEDATIHLPLDDSLYEQHLKKLIAGSTHEKKEVVAAVANMESSY